MAARLARLRGACCWKMRPWPRAPAAEEERTHWDKNMQLILDIVTGEDFPAGRTIQIGLTSGAQTQLVFGRNEPALIHYHQAMGSALGLEGAGMAEAAD